MSFTNYEQLGQLALDFQPGVLAMQRGEEGLIWLCRLTEATPTSNPEGLCFNELPVTVKTEEGSKNMFVKPITRILTDIPTFVACNSLIPVKFFIDRQTAICQGTTGLYI